MAGRLMKAIEGAPMEEPPTMDRRAATTDAARARGRSILERTIMGVPGIRKERPAAGGEEEVFAKGLQAYLAGDLQSAADAWKTIPENEEAHRGLQRIYWNLGSGE